MFTSSEFTGVLEHSAITIGMDGKEPARRRSGDAAWTTSSMNGFGAA
jgi:hypothetical protein